MYTHESIHPSFPPLPAFASPLALPLQELAVGGDFLLQVGFDAQKDLVFAVLPLQVAAQLQQFLLIVGDDPLHVLELAGVPGLGLRQHIFQSGFLKGEMTLLT